MNYDEKNPDVQKEIGLELEARIVAWVAGEASAFEVAELTRLTGERPELAIFKRRIAAVQGLVAEAVRPERNPLRLSPERRASLLQAIGATGTAEETVPAGAVKGPRLWVTLQWQTREYRRWLAVAACAVLGLFLFLLSIPSFQRVRYARISESDGESDIASHAAGRTDSSVLERLTEAFKSRDILSREARAADEARRREVMEFAMADKERRKKAPEDAGVGSVAVALPDAAAATSPGEGIDQAPALADIPVVVPNATFIEIPAQPPVPSATDSDVVAMAPMVVEGAADATSYRATSTLAGTRVRTDLRNVAQSVSVVTEQFLKDTGAKNSQDLLKYTPETEVGGVAGNFSAGNGTSARVGGQDWASKTGDFNQTGIAADAVVAASVEQANRAESIPSGSGGSADNKGQISGGKSEGLEVFSQYVVGASAEPVQRARKTSAGHVVAKSDASAGGAGRDDDKRAEPAARPAPPADVSIETNAAKEPVSTFSLHVSDVSFRLAQAALARGEAPDPAAIRPEEFYNAFDYGDPAPAASEKIACRIEQAAHPILQQRNLVRIAMRVPATGRGAGQPLRLTVLLDTSGSMEREDRAASVHRAMEVLVSLLGANDRLTLIGFARQPRLLAEQVPGDQARQVLDIVMRTPAEGGTNIEEALKLGSELARRNLDPQAQNRIVLLTDGAANLGNADPAQLALAVETLRQQGVAFDACGVGTDGLDDAILEALTRKGDGRYYVLDSPESADAGFARQLAGAFRPAAENVKVQVRFNPARVRSYRLIGFEHHRLREEDFRNDKVDAAELAAEEAAVALYQVEPLPQGEGELGEVYVRFRDAATRSMVERSWTMTYEPNAPAFDRATPTMQLAGTAALLAEKLQGGAMAGQIRLEELAPAVNALRGRYEHEVRVQQLVAMFEQLRRLEGK